MVSPTLVTGVVVPVITSWLSDQLPRPGLPASENERRIRNIVLATIVGFGVGAIVRQITGAEVMAKPKKEIFTSEERLVLPGYYGD